MRGGSLRGPIDTSSFRFDSEITFTANETAIVGSAGPVDPLSLVFLGNLFICAVVAVFFIFSLPRAAARFSRASEYTGFILRKVELTSPIKILRRQHQERYQDQRGKLERNGSKRSVQSNESSTTEKSGTSKQRGEKGRAIYEVDWRVEKGVNGRGRGEQGDDWSSDNSHTLMDHDALPYGRYSNSDICYPAHVQAWSTNIPPVARLLRYRVSPGLSLAQSILLLGYFLVLFILTFHKSNPFVDTLRTGYVAMAQIPVVYAFAAKNNVVGWFVGVGYEKLNYFHRFAGRTLVLAANVHSVGYFYKFAAAGTFTELLRNRAHLLGLIGLACLNLIFIFSTEFCRQRVYNLFLFSHYLCSIIFLPAVCLHKPALIPYVLLAIIFLCLDHILRTCKTRIVTAYIRPLPSLSLTHIHVPDLNTGWRAGQHVRVRILSPSLPTAFYSALETHPFTIASVPGTEEGLVLMAKKSGRWTTGLYQLATAGGYGEKGLGAGRGVKVMIEGPYGGPGHTVFASYSAAMIVVGGSGITFGLSVIGDLIKKRGEGKCRVKVIELVWSVQDPSCVTPLLPILTSLLEDSARHTSLNISVHYTRAPPAGNPLLTKDLSLPGLTISAGRPRTNKILDAIIDRTVHYQGNPSSSSPKINGGKESRFRDDGERLCGVVVGVCGPVGLGDEVAGVVGNVEATRRDAVGGVEIHEEVFGW